MPTGANPTKEPTTQKERIEKETKESRIALNTQTLQVKHIKRTSHRSVK